jgi:galactokinase
VLLQDRVTQHFQRHFGSPPQAVVRAPGRVNLIGEHTDYNDGFVLPMAIDRAIWIALKPRDDGRVVVHSLGFDQTIEFALNDLHRGSGWAEYIKGVAWAWQQSGRRARGLDGVVAGDVPVGAGLSSSAAWELASARAFSVASGSAWDAAQMALLGQRAENQWVGVNCGIMDQMISAAGIANHALLIDCRSLETQSVPLPANTAAVVLDTATRRGLVDSAYNERRAQCESAAKFFGVKALRDVSVEQFEAAAAQLDLVTRRRARHVITENDRTLHAAESMRRGDPIGLGCLMRQSHVSLRDDFEVSSRELNLMVECAERQAGCYGARMTGAGFAGCAVALVRSDLAQQFGQNVTKEYQNATGLAPNVYVCAATNGAEVVPLK